MIEAHQPALGSVNLPAGYEFLDGEIELRELLCFFRIFHGDGGGILGEEPLVDAVPVWPGKTWFLVVEAWRMLPDHTDSFRGVKARPLDEI